MLLLINYRTRGEHKPWSYQSTEWCVNSLSKSCQQAFYFVLQHNSCLLLDKKSVCIFTFISIFHGCNPARALKISRTYIVNAKVSYLCLHCLSTYINYGQLDFILRNSNKISHVSLKNLNFEND